VNCSAPWSFCASGSAAAADFYEIFLHDPAAF
jgi:hypothetical protein